MSDDNSILVEGEGLLQAIMYEVEDVSVLKLK